jgi:hypothetical protein
VTAAVPDPSFRDQLAEALHTHRIAAFSGDSAACACDHQWRTNARYREHQCDEVDARVQATSQRAAGAAGGNLSPCITFAGPQEFLRYDRERGEIQTRVDGLVREVIEVRRRLEDQMVLTAVVQELRRLGFTVTHPKEPPVTPYRDADDREVTADPEEEYAR